MTILAAFVTDDRVLLASDGRSLKVDPRNPIHPELNSTERNVKMVDIPNHPKLMVGITGLHGTLSEFRDLLAKAPPFGNWRDVADYARKRLVTMNSSAQARASRAGVRMNLDLYRSGALVAGIVAGRPGAVTIAFDGNATLVEQGPCFMGGIAFMMPALLTFAKEIGSFEVTTAEHLGAFLEAAEGVFPDILPPFDTWELIA